MAKDLTKKFLLEALKNLSEIYEEKRSDCRQVFENGKLIKEYTFAEVRENGKL